MNRPTKAAYRQKVKAQAQAPAPATTHHKRTWSAQAAEGSVSKQPRVVIPAEQQFQDTFGGYAAYAQQLLKTRRPNELLGLLSRWQEDLRQRSEAWASELTLQKDRAAVQRQEQLLQDIAARVEHKEPVAALASRVRSMREQVSELSSQLADLQDQLQDTQEHLDATRRENAALRKQLRQASTAVSRQHSAHARSTTSSSSSGSSSVSRRRTKRRR